MLNPSISRFSVLVMAPALLAFAPRCAAQAVVPATLPSNEQRIVRDSAAVLEEMLSTPGKGIPRSMLSGAEGVAIVPRVIKGGFIVGARHGRGVVVTKDANGVWHAPVFLSLTGGNVGWQAGVQSTDVVLVYRSQRSIDSLMQGKLTIGADAAAAAGPVGREAAAATDATLRAEIYSYSRSRGLFAGVSLDGSVLKVDQTATAAYYRPTSPGGPANVPVEAQQLTTRVAGLADPQTVAPAPDGSASSNPIGLRSQVDERDQLREQIADAAPRLFRLLDANWQQHLALPASIFREAGHASPQELNEALARYNRVATEPAYAKLAARPEFVSVYGLLRHYAQLVSGGQPALALPPPPA